MNNNNSLAHTSWNCKYHIVFALKYRRKILRELCEWKDVNIIEAEASPEHIHMLLEISSNISVRGIRRISERKKQSDKTSKAW